MMKRENIFEEDIYELSGLSRNHPVLSLSFVIILFSLAGIPPMAGFFAKFYVFMTIIELEMYAFAVVALITTVVSAFYYLRLIKIIYFDKPKKQFTKYYDLGLKLTLALSTILILTYFIYPSILLNLVSTINII